MRTLKLQKPLDLSELQEPVVTELPKFGDIPVVPPSVQPVSVQDAIYTAMAQADHFGVPLNMATGLCVGCGAIVPETDCYCVPCTWAKHLGYTPPLEVHMMPMAFADFVRNLLGGAGECDCEECTCGDDGCGCE